MLRFRVRVTCFYGHSVILPLIGANPVVGPSTSRAAAVELIELSSDSDSETLASVSRSSARKRIVVLCRGVLVLSSAQEEGQIAQGSGGFCGKG